MALEGRHVVVTGGGVGIGRAIAERLAAEGARLSLLAPNLDELEEVAARVGGGAHLCDIRERDGVDAAFAAAAEARGPIHALVANSGVGGPNADGPDDRFAGIDYGEDGTRVYIGKYVEFDALRLTSLREIDGW